MVEELEQLEEKLWIEEYRFNLQWMEAVLADDFFEYGRSGRTYTRQECLDIPKQPIEARLPLKDYKVRKISDDVFQVTYESAVTYNNEVLYGLRSSIWQLQNGRWKLKFHQGTPLIEPA